MNEDGFIIMKNLFPLALAALFLLMPITIGCQGSPTYDPILPGGDLLGINLEPQNVLLEAGNITKFLATGIFPGGVAFDLTPFVEWVSSDPSVAFFLSDGTLVANAPGDVIISAKFNGMNSQTVSVNVPGAPSGGEQTEVPVLRSITVTPKFSTIDEEESIQFACMGNFSDGSEVDYTTAVEWRISDPSLGIITPNGMFFSIVGEGILTISAKYGVFESNYVVLAINATV